MDNLPVYILQTFDTFISYIKKAFIPRKFLKFYCLFTRLNKEEVVANLRCHFDNVEEIGESISFNYDIGGSKGTIYAFLKEESSLLLIFSFEKKEEVDRKIENFINRSNGIYFLWIEPRIFKNIKEMILKKYENSRIIKFWSKREQYYKIPSRIRPHISRNINYRGEDGTDTLREIEFNYGILPSILRFEIPGIIEFSMHYRNIYVLYGSYENIDILFSIVTDSLKIISEKIKIFEESRFALRKERIGDREVSFLENIPFYIKLSGKKSEEEIKYFFSKLEEKENYCIMNPVIESGSLYYSASIFDGEKLGGFVINGDDETISILPRGNCKFDIFSRFFECVVDKLDEEARCFKGIESDIIDNERNPNDG